MSALVLVVDLGKHAKTERRSPQSPAEPRMPGTPGFMIKQYMKDSDN